MKSRDFASRIDGEGHIEPDWLPVDLSRILAGKGLDEPPSILNRTDGAGLIYRARVHSFYGEAESGKGWLALAACLEQVRAGDPVLYIDFEDSATTAVSRLRALGATDQEIGLFNYICPDSPITAPLVQEIPGIGATLAVLDGITEGMGLHGLDLRDNADVARFIALLPRPLSRMGCAVIMIDHVTKDRDGRGRFAIGAQHKLAGIDGAAYAVEVIRPFGRGLEASSRLTIGKDRPGFVRALAPDRKTIGELRLSSADERVRVTIEPAQIRPADPLGLSPASRRVLEALGTEDEAMTVGQIGDRVVEQGWAAGLHRRTIEKSLAELAEQGLADTDESEYAARWWRR